jgi:hypothetical protein
LYKYSKFLNIICSAYKNGAILIFLVCFSINLTQAQSTDTLKNNSDSLINKKDTTTKPTYKIATNDLKANVNYKAEDSIVYDATTNQFYLYKKGEIKYDDLLLEADYITYNTDSSTLGAKYIGDTLTDTLDKPYFKQADQEFTFNQLKYNFKSERALVEGAKTKYNDGFIISESVKRNKDKSIYGIQNIYTTCSLDTPHYGIYCTKIKVIPDVVGISGPARFQVEGLPTPLILPFGIFPLKKGQHAGFILPKYGFEQARGFGLREFGYYLPINEYMDMRFTGDIFSYGSWGAKWATRYSKRYNYSGDFELSYYKNITENPNDIFNNESNTFRFRANHNIDPKKLNNASFGALIDIGSSNVNRFAFNNSVNNLINNTMTSNISYSKTFGKGYNFTASANHRQNNSTRLFDISLPNITFSASGITPFNKGTIIGKPKWYQKISFNYTANLVNTLSFYDTAFSVTDLNLSKFNNGMEQTLRSSYNTSVLKYFNISLSANYRELLYTRKRFRFYNATNKRQDTIDNYGAFTARTYGATANLRTNIYGLLTFKKGWVKGIRHHLQPDISFNYTPDFGDAKYGYYYETFLDKSLRASTISYFEANGVGIPTRGNAGSINFSLGNNLQAKVRSKDTANNTKLVKIFDNFDIRTGYNLVRKTNKWDDVSIGFSTNAFDKIVISGNSSSSMYGYYKDSSAISPNFQYDINKKLLRFKSFGISMGTQFTSKAPSAKSKATEEQKASIKNRFDEYLDFNVPWTITINATLGANNAYNKRIKNDSLEYTANFNIRGDVNLTPNWKIDYQTGFDFITKRLTATELGISRNLHCWELSFTIVPYGYGRNYVFSLRPKSSLLHDLNITRRRSFLDNF